MVLGTMFPTATAPPEQETGVGEPPLTDSLQLRKVNFARSPEEMRVALLYVTLPESYMYTLQENVDPAVTRSPAQEGEGTLTSCAMAEIVEVGVEVVVEDCPEVVVAVGPAPVELLNVLVAAEPVLEETVEVDRMDMLPPDAANPVAKK